LSIFPNPQPFTKVQLARILLARRNNYVDKPPPPPRIMNASFLLRTGFFCDRASPNVRRFVKGPTYGSATALSCGIGFIRWLADTPQRFAAALLPCAFGLYPNRAAGRNRHHRSPRWLASPRGWGNGLTVPRRCSWGSKSATGWVRATPARRVRMPMGRERLRTSAICSTSGAYIAAERISCSWTARFTSSLTPRSRPFRPWRREPAARSYRRSID
jgi:hypothetical protein